ncbi:MAG: alpha-amylase family glycosyl hydrolase [Flavihumibacter sp.]
MKRFLLPLVLMVLFADCKKDISPDNEPDTDPPVTVSFTGLVTADKTFPGSDESFTLVFDPSKGNRGLTGFNGDVYLHLGAITDKSTGSSDWKYVKSASFTTADPAVKMTRQNNGTYSFTLTPRSFLGVPAGENILKLAMLFRNAGGTLVTRNTDGSDIYLPLYNNGSLNLRFSAPEMQPTWLPKPATETVMVGQELTVTAIASAAGNITLSLNGNAVTSVTNKNAVTGKLVITQPGQQTITASAGGGTVSFTVLASGTVEIAALPAGAKQGVSFSNNGTTATFALCAPGKSFVNVVGDFNNWTPNAASFMKRTPDGTTWWTSIDGIDPSKQYAYQYWVDGSLKVADPYTEKILDPANDPYIPAANFSAPGTYPAAAAGIVSTFTASPVKYSWQHNQFTRPVKNNLVVYELLLRDFMGSNNYKTLADTIGYLKNLGVNAVELMPVTEFEGNLSWGYNPCFYFAPDKYYGSKTDLQHFIDVCHGNGMAVILDMVLNHSFGQSPMVQLYFDAATQKPAANNPWFNTDARHPYNVGYDFNHESAATQSFVKDVLQFWMEEYRVDGFRFDLSKGFTQNNTGTGSDAASVNAWSAYDASRIAIWKTYNSFIRSVDPDNFYVILEHFAADQEEQELSAAGMMLWNNLNYNFNEASMGWLTNSNFSRADYKTHGFTAADGLVSYMESHDEERMMFKNLAYGNVSGNYSVKNLATALKRQEMCAAFLFAVPGPKMIWQFGELGYDVSIEDNGRTGEKPLLWQYNTQPDRLALKNAFAKYIALKKNNAVFNTGNYAYDFSGAVKYIRLQQGGTTVVVIGNFDVVSQATSVDFGSAGTWYDAASNNQPFTTAQSLYSATLAPGEYHVFSSTVLQ